MSSKADQQVIKDEAAAEKAHRATKAEVPSGPIAPGCNEPGVIPPSVAGTSQDPSKRKDKE